MARLLEVRISDYMGWATSQTTSKRNTCGVVRVSQVEASNISGCQ